MKKKALYTLLSLLIVLALAVPMWSTVVRADTPTEISNWDELDAIRNNLSGDYTLMNDLDSTTAGYDEFAGPAANGGLGWLPIGTGANRFTGSFDGQDFEISDLVIDRPDEDYLGLFGWVAASGVVANVGIANANVSGSSWVGALVGVNFGTVISSYASGSVTGNERVGGLMGENSGTGAVSNCHSSGSVDGNDYVGGLVGINFASVSNSHSSASVTGNNEVGGLVGRNASTGTVSTSHSSGSVTGNNNVGGLVGLNWNEATVVMSYASGSVTGNNIVGGMVGRNDGAVNESYATGAVTRSSGTSSSFGGFVGWNNRGQIINCYSTGSVHYQEPYDDPTDRGFAGSATEGDGYEMTGNFWDIETSGQDTTVGQATGKPTVDMMDITTFIDAGWDIAAVVPGTTNPAFIWNIIHGRIYPLLSWQDPLGGPVAVLGDYESQLLDLLISRGFMAEHRGWDIIGDVGQYSAVVINLPTDPGATTFIEFLDEADQYGVGVVFLHQRWFDDPWGITLLHDHLGDPDHINSAGPITVYYEVLQEHPVFEGWQVGDTITLIDSGPRDCSWFDDYSGDVIADLGSGGSVWGRGVGVGAYGQSAHVLLASLGVGTLNDSHMDHWTEDARTIFINAVYFAVSPFAGSRIHGTIYEVICAELDGVTIRLYEGDVPWDETVSDDHGNYTVWARQTGVHTLVASKNGFRPQTRSIDIEDLEQEYTLHFRGDHGLVPNAPHVFYVLQVVNVWLNPPDQECALSVFKVLEVVNAWLVPIVD